MNLTDARDLAIALIDEHINDSLDWYEPRWAFNYNNRKGAAGVCVFRIRTIFMSREYVLGATYESVKNTILHEIAHALLDPRRGHDSVWRATFISLGGDGKRTTKADHITYLYEGRCNCSSEVRFGAHRLGRIKNQGTCPKCGSHITWTNTRNGQRTLRGVVITSQLVKA